MGCAMVKSICPFTFSIDSCVFRVSTACWNSGPVMGGPAGCAIFSMLCITPLGSSASLATCMRVAVSVKASTPLRRYTVSPSTGDVWPLLEHGGLDAGGEGGRELARRLLALLHEQLRLALNRQHGRDAEAHDEHHHDEHGDLDGQRHAHAQIRLARPAQ